MKRFIAGPCVIESAELLDEVAKTLVDINARLGVDIIFKASFDKPRPISSEKWSTRVFIFSHANSRIMRLIQSTV